MYAVLCLKSLKGRDHFEDAGVDRRALYLQSILKWKGRGWGLDSVTPDKEQL